MPPRHRERRCEKVILFPKFKKNGWKYMLLVLRAYPWQGLISHSLCGQHVTISCIYFMSCV
jgi:hypothetical protein